MGAPAAVVYVPMTGGRLLSFSVGWALFVSLGAGGSWGRALQLLSLGQVRERQPASSVPVGDGATFFGAGGGDGATFFGAGAPSTPTESPIAVPKNNKKSALAANILILTLRWMRLTYTVSSLLSLSIGKYSIYE